MKYIPNQDQDQDHYLREREEKSGEEISSQNWINST
jgi:hypothetical protein